MKTGSTLLEEMTSLFEEEALRAEMLNSGQIVNVDSGQEIMGIGQPIEFIPIVLEGSLKIFREDDEGRELLLYYIESGESCAATMTCCLEGRKSGVRAIVEEGGALLLIPIERLNSWRMKYDSWNRFTMMTYAGRFDELLNAVDQLAFKKLDERLWNYLKDKSVITGSKVLQLGHQEIASELHSSREVISRLLKKLEQQGDIRLGREMIELL